MPYAFNPFSSKLDYYQTDTSLAPSIGGTITGGTAGSILFVDPDDVIAEDNTNLRWDNSLNHLLIGTSLGSELMVNGNFDTGTTSWTVPSGWAYNSITDAVDHSSNGTGALSQGKTFQIGRIYEFTYTVSSWTVGSVTPSMGGATLTARSANGTYTERFMAVSTSGDVLFTPTNTSRLTIDSASLKQVSGVNINNSFVLFPRMSIDVTNSTQNLTTGTAHLNFINTGNQINIRNILSGTLSSGINITSSGEWNFHATGGNYFALKSGVTTGTPYMISTPNILGHSGAISAGNISNAPSTLTTNGSFGRANTLITTNTTLGDFDANVFINSSGGTVDVTFPAITAGLLREYVFKIIDATNTITLLPDGSNTIEGAGSYDMTVLGKAATFAPLATISNCSDFDNTDESTCQDGHDGCTWDGDVTCMGTYVSAGVWYRMSGGTSETSASDSFTTVDLKTVTVDKGNITSIV